MSKILSVGIDIGTTTTQVIFSRITIDNTASYFTVPRISVLDKEIVYQSPVFFTPLKQQVFIDGDKVRDIVAAEFQKAGFQPSQVDTGAVIITGEAARKENSKTVLETLSDFAGDFVVSTAGPDLESVISGKGSGAYQYSIDNLCTVVNLDIGGGTTNIALFDSGKVTAKTCYDIGGRLIRLDKDGTIQYIAPSAQLIADQIGARIAVGSRTDAGTLSKITDAMADILAQSVGLKEFTQLAEAVRTRTSSKDMLRQPIERICFSGGVADCVKSTSDDLFAFGDIGILLGRSIRSNPYFAKARQIEASQTIRATLTAEYLDGGSTPAKDPIDSETLYMIGDATPNGWSMDAPTAFTRDASNKYLFTWEGNLTVGSMKACLQPDGTFSCPFLRPSSADVEISASGVASSDFVYTTNPDDKWKVTEAGTYHITFDLEHYTIQVEKK